MIQLNSSSVLNINKLSVLLGSLLLLLLWINLEFNSPVSSHNAKNIDAKSNNSNIQNTNYVKTWSINPFLKSHDDFSSNDLIPTVTALQSSIPLFSSLKLKLHGIVYQQNKDSYAMISMFGAIQEIYSVNGKISEGLFITRIDKKRVVVNYFGEEYFLNIENTNLSKVVTESSSVIKTNQNSNFDEQIEFLEVDRKRNPIRLFMIRRPYPVYTNGEFQGYKIMPGSNADQFKRLGFRSGDIITYLNGIEFTGPGMKEYVIQQLTHEMTIDLTVLRDNQLLNINYGF